MILVHRYTQADSGPFYATLRIKLAARVDLIDVRGKLREEFGSDFIRYPRAFYISDHTTAGYVGRRLAKVLEHDSANIQDYLQVFLKLFPSAADYVHDKLHLRTELSEQHRVSFGRVDVSLLAEERNTGLTVNEYETLLMKHDLKDVLRNPLHFVAQIGREALHEPCAMCSTTRSTMRSRYLKAPGPARSATLPDREGS